MKRIITILSVALILFSCDKRENEFGRIDMLDSNLAIPQPITIRSVTPISGGAVIKVDLPDDDVIRGVIATYKRGNTTVSTKISRYVDSLVVEGFADTEKHTVEVASFNVNEVKSEAKIVEFQPLTPAILSVKPDMFQTFGGIKIRISGNEPHDDLAVCILRDGDLSDKGKNVRDIKWVEVTTLFTASNDITLTRRGIEPVEAIFGVYIRDKWGNITDTTAVVLTPLEEIKLNPALFKDAKLDDDNCATGNESFYPVKALWDGSGSSGTDTTPRHFFASDNCPVPAWLTIDLGTTARLSRIHTLPRIDYLVWSNAHPRDFEFWGSMEPTGMPKPGNPHDFDDSWVLLGRFTQFKPSGYEADGSVGTYTQEDRDYFNSGNDFEFDEDAFPHAYDKIRYLRVVFLDTFASFGSESKTQAVQIGEITPYGQVVKD